jgi:hypothetical protein
MTAPKQPQQSPNVGGQPAGSPQAQQAAQAQAEHALRQYAQAHGVSLAGFNLSALLPILIQLLQALTQGGGPQPSATP